MVAHHHMIWRLVCALLLFLSVDLLVTAQEPNLKQATDVAYLTIRVPADATLTIAGDPTSTTGPERLFVTPSLTPGKSYSYKLLATWEKDGKSQRVERVVRFKAGDSVTIDLTAPENVKGKTPDDKPKDKIKENPRKEEVPGTEKLKAPNKEAAAPKSRHFQFTYSATLAGIKAGETVSIWVPIPPTTASQQVKLLDKKLPKGSKDSQGTEPIYGNRIHFFTALANDKGEVPFSFVYEVKRKEVGHETKLAKEDEKRIARFLQADELVPIEGKPLELLEGKDLSGDPMAKARIMYDVVNSHMKYSKVGTGWGRGDSVWACDSKFGNCSDFHSLFISMARANKLPAKFEIGFPLPEKRGEGDIGGYHCWAFFRPEGKGWVPVDISEANKNSKLTDYYFGNLTEDRVTFSTGRDINLVPKQDGKALNFFIYPYAEVAGKAVAQEKFIKKFFFKDVK